MGNARKAKSHQVETNDVRPPEGETCPDDQGLSLFQLAGHSLERDGESRTAFPRALAGAPKIPYEYAQMEGEELDERIASAKERLVQSTVILGHHYQRDEIVKFADFRGDSFKLSQLAACRDSAEYIVFCGVHFMAESAEILSGPHQKVILPNLEAGCSMADMASIDDVECCWEYLVELCSGGLVPVTYMNSAASLKAFCGRNGGVVCTSSNAPKVLRWAFKQGKRVLFFPDEHLGRNTADKVGLDLAKTIVWDPSESTGGHDGEDLMRAELVLWQGFCSVHQRFTVDQIRQARQRFPGINVVVHPECSREVVQEADSDGSTEFIADMVTRAPSGSQWAVGTEINLVNRLAKANPDKLVFCLDPVVCPCSTMYRIHPAYLAWVLEELLEGKVINQITVDHETASWARIALQRMLSIS